MKSFNFNLFIFTVLQKALSKINKLKSFFNYYYFCKLTIFSVAFMTRFYLNPIFSLYRHEMF